MSGQAVLRTEDLTKRYGGVVALDGVDVSIYAGQVTALLGENGAGKSTFVACCSGARAPDSGAVYLDETRQRFATPHAAAAAGVGVVHQEPQMLEQQTVAQNVLVSVALGLGAGRVPSRKELECRTGELLDGLGLAGILAPGQPVRGLSGAQRQLVEIARALVSEPKVLFLDEPNASLGDDETELLFAVVRRLQARGVAVILISHRLAEVYRIADRVIVMCDGRRIADATTRDLTIDDAVAMMGGRPREARPAVRQADPRPAVAAMPALELREFSGAGFRDISMSIRPGEILGMAGLVGAGRTELALGVVGATTAYDGDVLVQGERRRFRSPGDAVRHGIVYVAEDRRDAVFYDKSVDFNVRAGLLGPRQPKTRRPGARQARRLAKELTTRLSVKTRSLDAIAASLSGGNQQKLMFARALALAPNVLILDEPTHGVDIGTRRDIHTLIQELAADGMAVWVISSELDELLDVATRIVVLRQGRLVAEVAPGDDPIPILAAALGAVAADQEPAS